MSIVIAGQSVGPESPLFVIAEIGLNHGGSLDAALALVDAAGDAGASAVKLQTLRADGLVAGHCPPPAHVAVASLRDFFRRFELDEAAHRVIAGRARARGLALMSTPFDEEAVNLLERVGVDAYKIASGDLTHRGLIMRVAATGKPMVLSTGMSAIDEVTRALDWARNAGGRQLAVLHCVSAYPVPAGSENLAAVATLARATGVPVGLSDHGTFREAAAIAVAFGASLYERHVVDRPESDAIDRAVSSTPAELRDVIAVAERARRARGDGRKVCLPAEAVNVRASRRGLYARRPIAAGEPIMAGDLVALRPADGIAASDVLSVIGQVAARPVKEGAALTWTDLTVSEVPHAV